MTLFATLDDLKKKAQSGGGGSKNMFLAIKSNESKKIRFRQELTEDGALYDPEVGTARVVSVHTNPDDFRKRTACTRHLDSDNGKCLGCEQNFYAVNHVVINVAVLDTNTGDWVPKLLDQKLTPAHIGYTMIEMAEEFGTIVDRDYRFSRTGEQKQTNYNLIPTEKSETLTSIKDLEIFDVSKTYPELSYQKQVEVHAGDSDDLM